MRAESVHQPCKWPKASVRWDHALGSETGQRTDHVPLPTLSQEADPSAFSFILPAPSCTLILLFSSPPSFLYSERPQRNATCSSTHPTCHHVTLTSTAAAPSEHTTRHAQLLPPLPPLCHALFHPSSVPLRFHLRLATPPPKPRCRRHQYPPRRHCLTMWTKDTKPVEN